MLLGCKEGFNLRALSFARHFDQSTQYWPTQAVKPNGRDECHQKKK
jgi:hypothetical protein